jgi:uncharacterized protein with PIN domain
MKIIKQGTLKTKIARCEYCKCEFAFTIADVYRTQNLEARVDCPCCKSAKYWAVKSHFSDHETRESFLDYFPNYEGR